MSQLALAIAATAKSQFALLREAGFSHWKLGGALFLGGHYAEPRRGILMLGINPGRNAKDPTFGAGLPDRNFLLEGAEGVNFPYWRNAKYLFGSEPLKTPMQSATYSFCSPFRTPNLSLSNQDRALLVSHSRPILRQMLAECAPRLIIVAGVSGAGLLREIAGDAIQVGDALPGEGDAKGKYQWRAYRAVVSGSPSVVAQIPHLSRANSRTRLDGCRRWLVGLVNELRLGLDRSATDSYA